MVDSADPLGRKPDIAVRDRVPAGMDDKDRLLSDIEKTREEMSATVIAIEERLSPAHVKEQLLEQFHEAKESIKADLKEELREAKKAVGEELKNQLAEAKSVVSVEVKDQIENAKHLVKEQFEEAKSAVKRELTEAKENLREATIGRVETMVTNAEETVKTAGRGLAETIRANPIPSAMVGIGLGWLLMNSRAGKSAGRRITSASGRIGAGARNDIQSQAGLGNAIHRVEDFGEGVAHKVKETSGDLLNKVKGASGDVANKVKETTGEIGHKMKDVGTELAEKVKQSATSVKESTSHLADDAQAAVGKMMDQVGETARVWAEDAKHFEQRFENNIRDNPLAYGAIALAVGTAVGLSLPRTQIEDNVLGGASDKLIKHAETFAHEALDKMQGGSGQGESQVPPSTQERGHRNV